MSLSKTDLIMEDNKSVGASIDLRLIAKELGYVPHPKSICEDIATQQELWLAFTKHVKKKDGRKYGLRAIPSHMFWTGTNIGYYEGNEFTCTAEEDTVDPQKSKFYIFWKDTIQ